MYHGGSRRDDAGEIRARAFRVCPLYRFHWLKGSTFVKKFALLMSLAATASLALAACGSEAVAAKSTPTAAATQAATATAAAKAAATATPTATPAGPQVVSLTALEDGEKYSYDQMALTAKTGELTIKLANKAGNARPHTVAIRDAAGKEIGRMDRVASGANGEMKFTLAEAGAYQIFCVLQGHEDKGQKGTLTVTKG